jgi:hypothetical protein
MILSAHLLGYICRNSEALPKIYIQWLAVFSQPGKNEKKKSDHRRQDEAHEGRCFCKVTYFSSSTAMTVSRGGKG